MESKNKLAWTLVIIAGFWLFFRAATGGTGKAHVVATETGVLAATPDEITAGTAQLSAARTFGIWVAAIFTLSIFSFLYRDNVFYKLAEAIVVGVSAAYWMVVGFWTTVVPNLLAKVFPGLIQGWAMPGLSRSYEDHWYFYIVPLILCVMLLWRLAPKGAWISRWPLAFTIGAFAGIRMIGFIQADFLSQIRNSIAPLVALSVTDSSQVDIAQSIRNTLMFFSVLACLVYFFFSIEHKGVVGKVARVGIWVLMITFGAAFGYTVMGRIALLAIRLEFLFKDWLNIV